MKKMAALMLLTLSTMTYAGTEVEFDQNLEIKCHQEAMAAKCINQQGEPNLSCIDKNADNKVSLECKSLYRATAK